MKKWQKVQQTSEYFVDGIALVLATLITYLVFGKGLHRILLYTADEWKSYCFMMFVAYSAIAVGFASSIDLAKRQRIMELLAVLRNCSLTYMSFAVLLLVFKNPMIDSRYLFIGSYLLFILFSCLGRYVLKRVLTNNFSNSRNATLVGVVTTPDRAEQFVQSLQEDWTKRVDGVTILHADALAATASVGNPGAYRAMHSRTVEKRCCGVPSSSHILMVSWALHAGHTAPAMKRFFGSLITPPPGSGRGDAAGRRYSARGRGSRRTAPSAPASRHGPGSPRGRRGR